MPFKKDDRGNPIFSDKQKAVLLYGQRLRGQGNVSELIKHLRELGYPREASLIEGAVAVLKGAAQEEYKANRLWLDPEWKDPVEVYREQMKLEESKWQSQRSQDSLD